MILHAFLFKDEIFESVGRNLQPRSQDTTRKKQLSITLNRQGLLKESSNRLKKLNSSMGKTNEALIYSSETAEAECNRTKHIDAGKKESIPIKEDRHKPRSNISEARRPSKTNADIVEDRSDAKSAITRLDFDFVDSNSEASSALKEDLSSKREGSELVSRKAMVKSDRPKTKPVPLRKFITLSI